MPSFTANLLHAQHMPTVWLLLSNHRYQTCPALLVPQAAGRQAGSSSHAASRHERPRLPHIGACVR